MQGQKSEYETPGPPQSGLDRRGLLTTAAIIPFAALASCRPKLLDRKINPAIVSRRLNTKASTFTPEELRTGQILRANFLNTLIEFIPNDYLARGVILQEDGEGYWAGKLRYENLYDGKYATSETVLLGAGGQPYTGSAYYTEEWKLTKVHLRAGAVPAFIRPDKLPRPIPGFTSLYIPQDKLKEVAEQVYDLPIDLVWNTSYYRAQRYMSNLPEEDFMRLEASGEDQNGRRFKFSIDEQSFSGLNVTFASK